MRPLRSLLTWEGPEANLDSGKGPISGLVGQLDGGASPAAVIASVSLDPRELIAAIAADALGGDQSLGPALAQTAPKAPRLLPQLSEAAWTAVWPKSSRTSCLNLAAGLLLIHDFWDESHSAAQSADDLGEREFSAYWHGIAHRREPDAGNASYWFRRVGRHPVFAFLAEEARPVLEEHGDAQLTNRLISGGWNPSAMIELCTQIRPGTPRETLARRLQRMEMWVLLEATVKGLVGGPAG
jgi:hypothetical protein